MRPSPFKSTSGLRSSLRTRWASCAIRRSRPFATRRIRQRAYAGVVVLSYPTLEVVEKRGLEDEVDFSHYLSLRFAKEPLLLKVFRTVDHTPDVLVFDGQGLAHPRHMGIARTWAGVREAPASDAPNRCCSAAIKSPTTRKARGGPGATHRARSSGRYYVQNPRRPRSLCRLPSTGPPRRDFASSWRVRAGYAFPETDAAAHNFVTSSARR